MRLRSPWPYAACLAFLLVVSDALAQSLQWAVTPVGTNAVPAQQTPPGSWRHTSALDSSGNLFIAAHDFSSASSMLPDGFGQFLGKYSSTDGSLLWRYSSGSTSTLWAVAVDAAGDAFVSGQKIDAAAFPPSTRQFVARISGATGAVIWQVMGIPGEPATNADTGGVDIVLDASGNPTVIGFLRGYAAVTKYSRDTGAVLWAVSQATDSAYAHQRPFGLLASPDGNVVGITFYGDPTTGPTPGSVIFKLDGSTGARIWQTPMPWSFFGSMPEIRDFILDGLGKPTVVGKAITKYSNVDGSVNWQRSLSDDGSPSFAYGVAAASNGDLFVTGTQGASSGTITTARLRSADGATIWQAPWPGGDSSHAQAGKSITVDVNGDVLVAAQAYFSSEATPAQLVTMNYRGDTGQLIGLSPYADGASNSATADLELTAPNAAYTIGHFVRSSDGRPYITALKYTEARKVVTQMSMTASPSTASPGEAVTLTVTLSGPAGAPTGMVQFNDLTVAGGTVGGNCTSNVPITSGVATCTVSTLSHGVHPIRAFYAGDSIYGSTTADATVTISTAVPTVNVMASPNPSSFQQGVTLTASVTGAAGTATGTVTFIDGSGAIYGCSALPLSGGSATCTLNGLVPGTHNITVSYSGDAAYDAASSSAISETVTGAIAAPATGWSITTSASPQVTLQSAAPVNGVALTPASGVDASGNLYAVASTSSSANACLVVIKYAAGDGSIVWRRDVCNSGATEGKALAVDRFGDPIVTGTVGGNLYVARLAGATGVPRWERTIAHGSGATFLAGIAIGLDSAGNARVWGWDRLGATIYAFRNSDGATQWQTTLDTAFGNVHPRGFAVDPSGVVVVSESHQVDVNENFAGALTRLDGGGTITWRSTALSSGPPTNVVIDPQGNVVGATLSGVSKWDLISGSLMWQRPIGGVLAVDAQANIYLASAATASGGPGSDAYFVKLSPSGQLVWSRLLVDPNTFAAMRAVTLDTDGNPVALGTLAPTGQPRQQATYKLSASDGSLMWMTTLAQPGIFYNPDSLFATPQGVMALGELVASGGTQSGLYAVVYGAAQPSNPPRLMNISTRGMVGTGNDVMIGGFIIGGTTPKTVVVRARGPSLSAQGVQGVLGNPLLQLFAGQTQVAVNDNWADAPNAPQLQASGFAPSDARESAIMVTLSPGAYTAIVTGVGGGTGIAIVEVFEVDHPEEPLINIATRAQVLTGDDVMIGGFIIQGDRPQTVVVRARGPSMTSQGVARPLANPMLQLFSGQTQIGANDNWGDATNAAQLQASGFAPADALESAILVTLQPGPYTAIVTGVGGATGIGIVEVFSAP